MDYAFTLLKQFQRWVCDYHKDCENGEDEYANCRKC